MSDYQYPLPNSPPPPSARDVALPSLEERLQQLEERLAALLSATDYLLQVRIYSLPPDDSDRDARAEAHGYLEALKQMR